MCNFSWEKIKTHADYDEEKAINGVFILLQVITLVFEWVNKALMDPSPSVKYQKQKKWLKRRIISAY